jgi:GDPmannose 4,6-dehydratase
MKKKIALITGVTGQDGSYLAELLLKKNYVVYGCRRRSSSVFSSYRIDHLYKTPELQKNFILKYLDLTDSSNVNRLLSETKPDEVYNLAAQSHVGVSFEQPEYTSNVNALGTLRLLEAIKINKLIDKTRFYQASSSEIFGNTSKKYLNEKSNFSPISPYSVSKLFSYHTVLNYRNGYNIFASNGILFNHESPRRGEFFVTRKIVLGLIKIKLGLMKTLFLGNLDSKRDWGHAEDYVEAQWRILQYNKPDDFVISTGVQISVRDFIKKVAKKLNIKIVFKGKGLNEVAYDENKKIIIRVSKNYFRPLDVTNLLGDYSKAKKLLNWKPKKNLDNLIDEMIKFDFDDLKTRNKN